MAKMPARKHQPLKKGDSVTIVFVCTINRLRSVMAEYLFKNLLEKKGKSLTQEIKVLSAGIVLQRRIDELKQQGIGVPDPLWGYRPMPCAIFYMAKRGIDISEHRSKRLDQDIVQEAELIVCMTEEHKEAVLTAFPWISRHKVLTLGELSRPFELLQAVTEPPGLMPSSDFCLRQCDHWWVTEKILREIEERFREAKDKILIQLIVQG